MEGFWEKGPIAIAHRGGDASGPEKRNTMAAFQAAFKLGYKYAETDVILAASGELVLIHGSHDWLQAALKRDITRQTLQKMTLEQIRTIFKPGGEQVPLLEEVLVSFPGMKFILDLKTDETTEPLAKLVKRLKAERQVCAAGFSYKRTLRFVKALGSTQASTGLTVGRGLRFRNMNMFMLKSGRLSGVEAILMHHSLVSQPMLGLVHRRGFKAVIWTANSRLSIKHAVRSGADGIISDRITLLKQTLEAN
jgi:glycerophosphoryl diester phosphodiesterase